MAFRIVTYVADSSERLYRTKTGGWVFPVRMDQAEVFQERWAAEKVVDTLSAHARRYDIVEA